MSLLLERCSVCRGVSLSGNRTRITTSIRGRGCLAIGTAARYGGNVKGVAAETASIFRDAHNIP
jgi:hypothetical protein